MNDRQRGLVIYISSGSSTQPTPMQSSYAGGKRLLDILAQNLQQEYPKITFQEQTLNRFSYFKMTSFNPAKVVVIRIYREKEMETIKSRFSFWVY